MPRALTPANPQCSRCALLPGVQPVGLDDHRLGIEPHRQVEIEPCGDLVTVYPVLSCFPEGGCREPHVTMASLGEDHGSQDSPSSNAPCTYRVRPLQPVDLDGISRVHWRACRAAYRFMAWSYTQDEVRHWYAGKLEAWDWGQVVCAEDLVVAYLAASGAHIASCSLILITSARALAARFSRRCWTGSCAPRRCTCSRRTDLPVRSMNGSAFDRWTPGGICKTGRSTSFTGSNSPLEPKTIHCSW